MLPKVIRQPIGFFDNHNIKNICLRRLCYCNHNIYYITVYIDTTVYIWSITVYVHYKTDIT